MMGTAPMGARFVPVDPAGTVKINCLEEGFSAVEHWDAGPEWVKYDGSNGEAIAAAMTEGRAAAGRGDRSAVVVNTDHAGPALSLSEERTHVMADRWRVPVGYFINPRTGECRNAEGTPQDWDALTAEG